MHIFVRKCCSHPSCHINAVQDEISAKQALSDRITLYLTANLVFPANSVLKVPNMVLSE